MPFPLLGQPPYAERGIYLIPCPAFPDCEKGVVGVVKKSAQIEGSILSLYADIGAANKNGPQVLGKFNSGEGFTGNGDRKGFPFPFDYPCLEVGS